MAKYSELGGRNRLGLETNNYMEHDPKTSPANIITMVMTFLAYLLAVFTFPVSVFCCVKIIQDYERAVIFRIGRLQPLKQPGIIFVLPCIDRWYRVDMRVKAFNVPPQKIVTKDQAAVLVGADVHYIIKDAIASKAMIQDLNHSLRVLAQTTIVNTMTTLKLIEIQNDKKFITIHTQDELNKTIRSWGIQIHRIEISEPQLICAPPEHKPPDLSQLFSGSDNPLNAIFQVMQGATGMMPQVLPQSINQPPQPTIPPTVLSNPPGLDPSQLVALVNHITDERLVQEVGCMYQFNIIGGDAWHLDLKNGHGSAGKGPPTLCPPDVVISLSSEDLRGLFSGTVSPFDAYMQGKVSIDGDVKSAMRLQTVVDRMRQRRGPAKTTHARNDVMIV